MTLEPDIQRKVRRADQVATLIVVFLVGTILLLLGLVFYQVFNQSAQQTVIVRQKELVSELIWRVADLELAAAIGPDREGRIMTQDERDQLIRMRAQHIQRELNDQIFTDGKRISK